MQRKTIRISLFIVGILLGLLVLYHLYLSFLPEIKLLLHFDHHNEEVLVKMVRSHGIEDLAFLFILNVICVAIPGLSNGIFCVLNGILYGPALGFIVNWISDIIGQVTLLMCLQKLYNPKNLQNSNIYKLLTLQSFPQIGLTVAYMIPFIPSTTVAYANALINKNRRKRMLPISVGTIPFAFLYAYGGDSILHLDGRRLLTTVITIVIIALIAILLLFIMRTIRKRNKTVA